MFYAIYMATCPRGFALVLVYFIKHSVSCYIYYIWSSRGEFPLHVLALPLGPGVESLTTPTPGGGPSENRFFLFLTGGGSVTVVVVMIKIK